MQIDRDGVLPGSLRFAGFNGCTAGNSRTGKLRENAMWKFVAVSAVALPKLGVAAKAEDTVKIGYIDPLSGGGASVGEVGLKTFQYLADEINAKGGLLGHKVEIVPM